MKKAVYLILATLVVTFSLLIAVSSTCTLHANTLSIDNSCKGVVNKKPGESFTMEITFKNIGSTQGTWSINVCFEDGWIWKGNAQTLTLNPGKKKTLIWSGSVPLNAPVGSIARLIVYFNNEYKALDWWIIVVTDAQLSIVQSEVK